MFKKIARSFALVLSLTLLAMPVYQAHAQSIVSGGNPVPTGEDSEYTLMVLGALSSI